MKIAGSNLVPFPVETVWDAILDPRVLVATIPGCERLAATGENAYDMTVTAGVAAIKGTYQGSCTLSDLASSESLVMQLSGAGAPGTIDATVKVFFGEAEPGVTKIDYEADAVVGGMVGGVGQRMLTSVSKRMAGEFFGNVASAIAQPSAASARDFPEHPCRVGAFFAWSGVLGAREEGRRLVAGRLPQGHRGRCRAGRARRRRRRALRAPADDEHLGRVHGPRPGGRRTATGDLGSRAARPAPGPDRRTQPRAQRDRLARRGARPCRCGGGRRGAGDRHRGRPAARAAVRVQGHPRRRRLAHDVRLAALRRPRPRARRPDRRAGTPRGRRRHRQDQRAGVRRRLAHLQPGLRPDPQPGRPVALRRRVVGRRRRARSRPGWCRWPTAPTWAARCATRRPSAAWSGCGRRSAGCRSGRSTTSGRPPPSAARWRATSATSPCCCR